MNKTEFKPHGNRNTSEATMPQSRVSENNNYEEDSLLYNESGVVCAENNTHYCSQLVSKPRYNKQ